MWQTLTRVVLAGLLSFATILPAWAEGTVARAQFSTDVIDREPIDDIGPVVKVEYGEIQRVYFFTDLRAMSGGQVIHRWKLDGEEQADVAFDIGGDRWRVWSSKRLMPGFDGKWSVDIVLDGNIVETHSFDYVDEY
ncbi:DUF2914 domain-containing protein [Marinomonas primoryensis]|jgi:hypothetical protein|uniref:DUF2914 domain-containing protein n=1 Tax=Marinomonas primoryensis TaxID=178399 RepID=UPI0030DC1001